MDLQLTINELGKLLKKIGEEYNLEVLIKMNLSGGWFTANGEAVIERIPVDNVIGCHSKSNNIIDVRIKNGEENFVVKITGAKDKKFDVDIDSGKYIELSSNSISINQVKTNLKECKIRIDKDIIFKVNTSLETIKTLINR
ncbi:MAG: UDP-N-acetylglucosamine pyrophosphorylase [Sarcina sp.]